MVVAGVVVARDRCGPPPVRVLARLRHGRARGAAIRADRAGRRLGLPDHRRLADRAAADAHLPAPPRRRRAQRAALLLGRRARCCSARTWSPSSATSSRPCSATARPWAHRRPLQRGAARRRRRGRALGPATRLDHDRQHRRRHRQDGPDQPAAQHDELPLRRGLGHGRAVPGRLRRRLPQRRQHLGRRPHQPVPQVRQPRHRRHDHGDRGDHRPRDQLLGDGQPRRLQEPRGRRRRRDPQRARADPGRGCRTSRTSTTSSPASASSTARTRSGSPAPARGPTTTRGWPGRSAS